MDADTSRTEAPQQTSQSRVPIALRFQPVAPQVTPHAFPHVIVIQRGSHELTLTGTTLGEALGYTGGLYYFDEHSSSHANQYFDATTFGPLRAFGDVELVSVDSMQVYRGMDIGTAKPTAAEQAEVPHHLLDRLEDPGVARQLDQLLGQERRPHGLADPQLTPVEGLGAGEHPQLPPTMVVIPCSSNGANTSP